MSSREIAELTGKMHKKVLEDIRKMLDSLGLAAADFLATAFVAGPNNSTRPVQVFNLPKRETMILVSGYSVVLRARIVDRWMELEEAAAVGRTVNAARAMYLFDCVFAIKQLKISPAMRNYPSSVAALSDPTDRRLPAS